MELYSSRFIFSYIAKYSCINKVLKFDIKKMQWYKRQIKHQIQIITTTRHIRHPVRYARILVLLLKYSQLEIGKLFSGHLMAVVSRNEREKWRG